MKSLLIERIVSCRWAGESSAKNGGEWQHIWPKIEEVLVEKLKDKFHLQNQNFEVGSISEEKFEFTFQTVTVTEWDTIVYSVKVRLYPRFAPRGFDAKINLRGGCRSRLREIWNQQLDMVYDAVYDMANTSIEDEEYRKIVMEVRDNG